MHERICFYDSETTGLPSRGAPLNDPSQPHLVQIAAALYDGDGAELGAFCSLVDPGPSCTEIHPKALEAHGITLERARLGIPSDDAVRMLRSFLSVATLRGGHNEPFDRKIMDIAATRAGVGALPEFERVPGACTMLMATPILKIPPTSKMIAAGIRAFKSANLGECVQHFFGETLDGAHDAMVDVRASARVFFHLRAMERQAAEAVT